MTLYDKSNEALDDWQDVVEYTLEHHGVAQTEKYTKGLIGCMEAMADEKGHFKDIDVNGRKIRIKHCQKHYIFALIRHGRPMMVIAILHERMDLMTRLKHRLS